MKPQMIRQLDISIKNDIKSVYQIGSLRHSNMSVKKNYHHKNLKEVILQETILYIEENGFEEISLRKIALKAGVAHTAIYHHYRNKDDLLAIVASELVEKLLIGVKNSNEKYPDEPYRQLFNYGNMYIDFACKNKNLFKLMFGKHNLDIMKYERLRETSADALKYLISLIEQCQNKRVIKKGPALQIAMSIWSITHGYATLIVDNRVHTLSDYGFKMDFSVENLTEFIFEVLKNGLLIETKKFFI